MRLLFHISILALVFTGCKKESFSVSNLNDNKIEVLGHAGMGFDDLYPVDSKESILHCLALNATGSEIDIQLTKDSVLVAFHGYDMEGTTNFTGQIYDYTWEELATCHYNGVPYCDYPILRMEDLFENLADYQNYRFSFDIKIGTSTLTENAYHEMYTNALIRLIDKYGLDNNTYFESNNDAFLAMLKQKKNHYQLYIYPQSFEEGFDRATSLGIKGMSIESKLISREQVDIAHAAGLFVTIWGVQSKEENNEAIRKNPDIIETDNVEYLVKTLSDQHLLH